MNAQPDYEEVVEQFRETGFVHLRGVAMQGPSELVTLASRLGKPLRPRQSKQTGTALQLVSDAGLFSNRELPWHNDWSYGQGGYDGTLLYHVSGGHHAPTWFADMTAACAALEPDLRDRLRDVHATYFPADDLIEGAIDGRTLRALRRRQIPRPLVFDHPVTDRPVLYFSPGTLEHCEDATVDLEGLIRCAEKTAWCHDWRSGDLLIYDNLRFMHRRPAFTGVRVLHRVQFAPSNS